MELETAAIVVKGGVLAGHEFDRTAGAEEADSDNFFHAGEGFL